MSPSSTDSNETLNEGPLDSSTRELLEENLEPTFPETPLSKWRLGIDN